MKLTIFGGTGAAGRLLIEQALAAGRVGEWFSVNQFARFPLLALIDWSYDLLTEEEKQLLRTASVFVGGWTLDALEAVSDDPNAIEHLEGLVNKSLVVTEERGSEMRYFMLETIRQYAREKLFEAKQSSAARDRHFVYFTELSEKMWDAFRSENLIVMVNRAKDEIENFRAAQEWGFENHVDRIHSHA